MRAYVLKKHEFSRKCYELDATGIPMGRIASIAVDILTGKNKPNYTANFLCGDKLIIINLEKMLLTGNKTEQKIYYHHTGFMGGIKETDYNRAVGRDFSFPLHNAIRHMISRKDKGRYTRDYILANLLRMYKDNKHEHQGEMPEKYNINDYKIKSVKWVKMLADLNNQKKIKPNVNIKLKKEKNEK